MEHVHRSTQRGLATCYACGKTTDVFTVIANQRAAKALNVPLGAILCEQDRKRMYAALNLPDR